MKLAMQTNAWTDALHDTDLVRILAEIAEAGYDGFEIGLKRVAPYTPAAKLDQLARLHNLRVVGIHIGSRFSDPDWHDALERAGSEAAEYSAVVSAPFLIISGQRSDTPLNQNDLARRADALNQLGRIAHQHGVALCYHNHDWEFNHNAAEWRYLLVNTDPALVSLQLDVGWVHRAGADVAMTVRELRDRTRCYHLKDDAGNGRWTEVGSGGIVWDAVFAEIAQNPHAPWLIVERDEAQPDALTSATASARFVRQQYGHFAGGTS